jgi:hypothetical protein
MQTVYNDLRQDVETVIRSRSVDGGSTIAVSPENLIREDWHNLIYSALEMIEGDSYMDDATGDDVMDDAKTGDDAMDDATGNDAMDNATVEVDEVLGKIVDNTIQAYGSSARDVYAAIVTLRLADKRITRALKDQNYNTLRDAVMRVHQVEAGTIFSHTIFSVKVMDSPGTRTLTVVISKSSLNLIGLKP